MYDNKFCFAAVEFIDDPNVVGYAYWYLSPVKDIRVGDWVVAPLGRHNNLQKGIVRAIRFETELDAPFPMHSIKTIKNILGGSKNV